MVQLYEEVLNKSNVQYDLKKLAPLYILHNAKNSYMSFSDRNSSKLFHNTLIEIRKQCICKLFYSYILENYKMTRYAHAISTKLDSKSTQDF